MIRTVFHSADLPPAERLDRFDAAQTDSASPMRVRSAAGDDFRATARELDLAAVNVLELTCSPLEVWRTPELIRRADPEHYGLIFALRGGLGVRQVRREAALGAGDFAVLDSSRPSRIHIAASGGTATLVCTYVPRALLPLPADRTDRLLGRPLPGGRGIGRLLTQFLTGLTTDAGAYRSADVARLSGIALDLLTATFAHHLGDDQLVPAESLGRTQLLRVQTFAQRHLREPQLTPARIAAAHHISVSHLHRLFQRDGTTVAAWIRGQRLERARRDLTDPALRAEPVHRIAARWGFNDHATFTRAFCAAYGVPPRDYRQGAPGTVVVGSAP